MLKRFGKTVIGIAIIGALMSGMMISASAAGVDDYQGYDMSQEPSYRSLDFNEGISTHQATIDTDYFMPTSDWLKVSGTVTKADIAVTKDCVSLGIDHGHSALLVSSTRTVEHYGPEKLGLSGADGYSHTYDFASMWQHCKTCRVYRYEGLTDTKKNSIATYAQNNLTGWGYAMNADRTSTYDMNCATLIWKAYNANGITLNCYWNGFLSNTTLPSDFVEQNPSLRMKASVGWTSAEHSWK